MSPDLEVAMGHLKKSSKIVKITSRRTIRGPEGTKTLEMVQEFDGTHEEAEFAALMLSMQVDLLVTRQAFASDLLDASVYGDKMASIKSAYGRLIVDCVEKT